MKRFLYIILLVVLGSCCRKPLYLRDIITHDKCRITTVLNFDASLQISTNINLDIQNNLVYQWDESIYGTLGYTTPAEIHGIFFRTNDEDRIFLYDEDFIVGEPKTTMIETNTFYDILFYNKTTRTQYDYGNYYKYYTSTPYLQTRATIDYSEDYIVMPQCEEQFAVLKKNLYIDPEKDDIPRVYENGVYVYHYNIDVQLMPASFIYIVQLTIVDDDNTVPMDVDSCTYMGISGLAREKELFSMRTTKERCLIESKNVKPLLNYNGNFVFAERFLTYGLVDDYNSTWGNKGLTYELGLVLKLTDGSELKGKVNITNDLLNKPNGGVIIVELKNSQIHKKDTPQTGGGFNVDVQEWNEEINVVIEI